jgi:hypothetical protein
MKRAVLPIDTRSVPHQGLDCTRAYSAPIHPMSSEKTLKVQKKEFIFLEKRMGWIDPC